MHLFGNSSTFYYKLQTNIGYAYKCLVLSQTLTCPKGIRDVSSLNSKWSLTPIWGIYLLVSIFISEGIYDSLSDTCLKTFFIFFF